MSDCCLIKKVATVEVYENKNEVRAYGFMAGDKNTPMMEVKFRHLWGEENLSKCKLRWIIVDDLGSLLVGEVPIEQDNTASIQLPNELFTGDRRMKVQLTVASCDGNRILNLQQFTDLKVINNLASNEVVEPVYQMLINQVYDDTKKYLAELETSYKAKYGSLESVYAKSKASLEQYLITAQNGGNAEFLQGYNPKNFNRVENTINELINSAGSKYKVGDIVDLNGYYTAGDGAHHKRKIESADDGSGVQLANGLWANIVHNGEVNVSWFGAKGDGVTDDGIFFSKALNFKKNLIVDDKDYLVKTKLKVIKNRVRAVGSAKILFDLPNNTEHCFEVSGDCQIENIDFDFKNTGLDGLVCTGSSSNLKLSRVNTYNSFRDSIVLDSSGDYAWKENVELNKVCVTNCGKNGYVFRVGGISTFINETVAYNIEVRRVGKNFENSYPMLFDNTTPPFSAGKKIGGLSIFGANFDVGTGTNWGKAFFSLKDSRLESFFLTGGGFEALNSSSFISGTNLISKNSDSIGASVITNSTVLNLVHFNANIDIPDEFKDVILQWTPSRKNLPTSLLNSIKSNFDFYSKNNDKVVDLTLADNSVFHPVAIVLGTSDLKKIVVDRNKNNAFSLDIDIKGNPNGEFFKGNRYFKYTYSIKNQGKTNYISKMEYAAITGKTYLVIWLKGGSTYSVRQLFNYTNIEEVLYNSSGGQITISNVVKDIETTVVETKFNNSHSYDINVSAYSALNTPYHTTKMQQEGIYEDFIAYMDSQHEYDKEKKALESAKQEAYQLALAENSELVYEDWLASYPELMPVHQEPVPSERLIEFYNEYK